MGCATGKPQSTIKNISSLKQGKEEKVKGSSATRSQISINDCDTQDISVNRISILEQSCVGMKISL